MLSRRLIGFCLCLWCGLGRLCAAFVGDYDESQWTLKTYGGDGAVDWLGESFLLDSGFTGSGFLAQADVTVRAGRSGTFHFNWTFYGGTTSGYRLSRIRNESVTTLVSRQDYAEGTASFSANAGDTIGFRISAPIDEFPAMAEIFSFFAPGQQPAILVQPKGATNCYGTTAIFSVVATNAVDYQWQFKGQNLPEELFEDLVIRALPPADSGNYRVVIRNPLGSVTSQAVPLFIVQSPLITTEPPASLTRDAGQNAILSVTAAGSNLRYQWQHNDTILAGATAATLTLSNLNATHTGQYAVIVSNSCGAITSASTVLTVLDEPIAIRIFRGPNRTVNIEVSGAIGRQYVLEVSRDLRNWTPKATNWLVISGSPLFYDVSDAGARCYRVCPLP